MPKIHFGHCIGCDQPIRPPYLSFDVKRVAGDGNSITEWDEIDVCGECERKLTVSELHRLTTADEPEAANG